MFQRFKLTTEFIHEYLRNDYADFKSPLWIHWISLLNLLLDYIHLSSQPKAKRLFKTCCALLKDMILDNHSTGMNRIILVLDAIFSKGFESSDHPRQTLLIGPCIEMALSLQNDGKSLENYNELVMSVVSKTMLGSKSKVLATYVEALQSFYKSLLSRKLYEDEIIASLDKYLLRSPEVVLSGK